MYKDSVYEAGSKKNLSSNALIIAVGVTILGIWQNMLF